MPSRHGVSPNHHGTEKREEKQEKNSQASKYTNLPAAFSIVNSPTPSGNAPRTSRFTFSIFSEFFNSRYISPAIAVPVVSLPASINTSACVYISSRLSASSDPSLLSIKLQISFKSSPSRANLVSTRSALCRKCRYFISLTAFGSTSRKSALSKG